MRKNNSAAILLLAISVATPVTFAACAKATARIGNSRAAPDDATITTRVKTALLNDPEIRSKIDVDTFNGVVTLSGTVKSAVERDKAMALARKITGVSDVKSTVAVE